MEQNFSSPADPDDLRTGAEREADEQAAQAREEAVSPFSEPESEPDDSVEGGEDEQTVLPGDQPQDDEVQPFVDPPTGDELEDL